jgi:diguanylate cyclase (GGDEF)-like protein
MRYRLSSDPSGTFHTFSVPLLADAFVACAAVGAVALLLPHPPEVREGAAWCLVVAALVGGLALRLVADRLPGSLGAWTPSVTIGFIFAAVWVGGPGAGAVALAGFFNLVAAVAFSFLPWRRVLAYIAAIGIGYGALLAGQEVIGWPALTFVLSTELVGVTFVSHKLANRLHDLAMEDELTGLENRRAWYRRVTDEIGRAERRGSSFSIAIIDLDHFKAVNDAGGHEAGDRLLVDIATAWRANLRAVDGLARWGGDEFALVLPDCDEDAARETVERLAAATPGSHTFSYGTAPWFGGESVDEMVRQADRCMYEAKRTRSRPETPNGPERRLPEGAPAFGGGTPEHAYARTPPPAGHRARGPSA